MLALAPIVGLLSPRSVHVTTYQALSGAGYPGVPSLTITDNVVPFISGEEEKIARESGRILGLRKGPRVEDLPVPFLAHCARVGTREGHLEAVTVESGATVRRSELEEAWREFDPLRGEPLPTAPHPVIELRQEADRPQPLRDRWAGRPARARGMAAVVGRVRWDPPFLRFFVLSHNAVRGGAGGSVLNAELALGPGNADPIREGAPVSHRAPPLVLKFGGASLADPDRVVRDVLDARRAGRPLVLVASAREGVTDLLTEALDHPRSVPRHQKVLAEVRFAPPGALTDGSTDTSDGSPACSLSSRAGRGPTARWPTAS